MTLNAFIQGILRGLLLLTAPLCVGLLCAWTQAASAAPLSVRYEKLAVNDIPVHAAFLDMTDKTLLVTPGIACDSPDNAKTFRQFLKDSPNMVQVTGAFFDLGSGSPVGDIVVRGHQFYNSSSLGSALVITENNEAAIVDKRPKPRGWKGYETVLQGGIRLVKGRKFACDPGAQGFKDLYMQRRTLRVSVGVLPQHRLVIVQTGDALLPELAGIMKQLGCVDAMALDGGGSTGFAFDGQCITSTPRKLGNVLMVVRRPKEELAKRQEVARLMQLQKKNERLRRDNLARRQAWLTLLGYTLGACALVVVSRVLVRKNARRGVRS